MSPVSENYVSILERLIRYINPNVAYIVFVIIVFLLVFRRFFNIIGQRPDDLAEFVEVFFLKKNVRKTWFKVIIFLIMIYFLFYRPFIMTMVLEYPLPGYIVIIGESIKTILEKVNLLKT